jgi:predicted phage-related endonuclease
MIVSDCTQLSEEWFAERAGNPGASSFDKIVTSTGAASKQSVDYVKRLAGEAIVGKTEDSHQNFAMQRGIEMQAEALNFFELVEGVEMKEVGICYPDDQKKYHCSPDALSVDEEVGLEMKCPLIHTHVGYLLDNKLPTKYIQQVQGSMLVTGFDHWFFLSYYPGLKPLLIKVERDEKFIEKLSKELDSFCMELASLIRKLKEM